MFSQRTQRRINCFIANSAVFSAGSALKSKRKERYVFAKEAKEDQLLIAGSAVFSAGSALKSKRKERYVFRKGRKGGSTVSLRTLRASLRALR